MSMIVRFHSEKTRKFEAKTLLLLAIELSAFNGWLDAFNLLEKERVNKANESV